jgi:hypothetical protein
MDEWGNFIGDISWHFLHMRGGNDHGSKSVRKRAKHHSDQ